MVGHHNGRRHAVGLVIHALVAGPALPLIDNLALDLGADSALLLNVGGALVLVPGAAALPTELIRAIHLEVGLLNSPGQADVPHLGAFLLDISTHGIGNIKALGLGGGEGLGHGPGLDITWIF